MGVPQPGFLVRLPRGARIALVGGAVGLLASAVNLLAVPILTPETPLFIFGGGFILALAVLAGLSEALVAAGVVLVLSFIVPIWSQSPLAALGGMIYVAEVVWVWKLHRRMQSITISVVAFWFLVGWALDWGIYAPIEGVDAGYIQILFVKQLLNGIMNALLAELLVIGWHQLVLPRFRGKRLGVRLREFVFSRIVFLAMLPVAVLGLTLARAGYEVVSEQVESEAQLAALRAADRLDQRFQQRREELVRIGQEPLADTDELVERFRAVVEGLPDVRLAALVGPDGRIRAIYPEESQDGERLTGLDLTGREYFERAMETGRTVYSDVFESLGLVGTEGRRFVVNIAEPLGDPDDPRGVLVLGLDTRNLMADEPGLPRFEGGTITVFDRQRKILLSQDEMRSLGQSMETILAAAPDFSRPPVGALTADQPTLVEFQLAGTEGPAVRLGIDVRFGALTTMLSTGWTVLVDRPGAYLRARLLPVSLTIGAVVLGITLLVVGIVQHLSRRIAGPYGAAATVAGRVVEGGSPEATLEELERSDLVEVRHLADSLTRLHRTVREREFQTRAREAGLESQLLQAQKMEAVGHLAGGVAHDFNNSLTPILGFAELGLETTDDPELRDHLEEIIRAARHARDVTHQLLAFGRKQTLQIEAVRLGSIVEDTAGLLRPLLRENVELIVDIQAPGAAVQADVSRMRQALLNLALNGQEAMPRGGTLTISLDRSEKMPPPGEDEDASPGPYLCVRVSDSGDGIDPKLLEHIFEPFFTTKGAEGSGLGLSVVHGIVKQHGGWIDVQSQPESGTTFDLYLPEVLLKEESPAKSQPASASRGQDGVLRILAVEDDPTVRKFLSKILEKEGFDVETFERAEEALRCFEDDPDRFDMLLSDIVLPGQSGHWLYRQLRESRPSLPTLFITGYSHDVLEESGVPADAHLLLKPFGGADLIGKVRDILGRGSSGESTHPEQSHIDGEDRE